MVQAKTDASDCLSIRRRMHSSSSTRRFSSLQPENVPSFSLLLKISFSQCRTQSLYFLYFILEETVWLSFLHCYIKVSLFCTMAEIIEKFIKETREIIAKQRYHFPHFLSVFNIIYRRKSSIGFCTHFAIYPPPVPFENKSSVESMVRALYAYLCVRYGF